MARSSLRANKRVTITLAVGLLLASTTVAIATYPVIDQAAIGKLTEQIKKFKEQIDILTEQLNVLKEQLSFLNDISNFMNDLTDAVGSIMTIKLPIPNLNKIADQLSRDAGCLMPDGQQWGLEIEDLEIGSICGLSEKYRSALFANPEEMKEMTVTEQNQLRQDVEARRRALFVDTVTRSIAMADEKIKASETAGDVADDLQANADAAETLQDRMAVNIQVNIAVVRATSETNQLLAQMLKLQGVAAMKAGLSPDDVPKEDKEGAEE